LNTEPAEQVPLMSYTCVSGKKTKYNSHSFTVQQTAIPTSTRHVGCYQPVLVSQ